MVERVRKLTGIRKVGHAGTLDPLASGVLLLCVGQATRLSEYLMQSWKVYRAEVRLGVATDTYDAEGRVVAERPVTVERKEVEAALAQFRGHIEQVPPPYSAVKVRGRPAHQYARRELPVQLAPRPVEIAELKLVAWDPPICVLELTCSPGTYVRTLAHDLGQALGCGGHLVGLTRLASGNFRLEEAVTWETFARAAAEGRWCTFLQPMDAALAHLPSLQLDQEAVQRLAHGQPIHVLDAVPISPEQSPILARAYGPKGDFVAVVRYDPQLDTWWPHKVFCSSEDTHAHRPRCGTGSA